MVTMTTEMIALNEFECFFSVKDVMFVQVYVSFQYCIRKKTFHL